MGLTDGRTSNNSLVGRTPAIDPAYPAENYKGGCVVVPEVDLKARLNAKGTLRRWA